MSEKHTGCYVGLKWLVVTGLVVSAAFSYSVQGVRADGEAPAGEDVPAEIVPGDVVEPDIVLNDQIESIADPQPDSAPAGVDPVVLQPYPPVDCDPFTEGDNPCPVVAPVEVVLYAGPLQPGYEPPNDCDPFQDGENPCGGVEVSGVFGWPEEDDGRAKSVEEAAVVYSQPEEPEKLPEVVLSENPSEQVLPLVEAETIGMGMTDGVLLASLPLDEVLLGDGSGDMAVGMAEAVQVGVEQAPMGSEESTGVMEAISMGIVRITRQIIPDFLNVCGPVAGGSGLVNMLRQYLQNLVTC